MKISIIVPVYNEVKTIGNILTKLMEIKMEKEIIIVDDGSKDGTTEFLHKLNLPEVKCIFHKKNYGKGAAIRTGIRYANGNIITIQDADMEYNPFEIDKVVDPIIQNQADIVFGSRFLKENPKIYKIFLYGNKFFTFLINLLFNANFSDTYTCYKAFRSDFLKKIKLYSNKFEIEAELSIKVARSKLRFMEVPITYVPRTKSEGKKISWRDAIRGFLMILKNL